MAITTFDEFESEGNNLYEGYMFLHNQSRFRPWSYKPKYFILTRHYIYCFKRRGDLNSIPRDVMLLRHLAVSINEETRGIRKRYYIKLESALERKSFNMFCFSIEERNEWFTKILQVLAEKLVEKGNEKQCEDSLYESLSLSKASRYSVIQSIELTRPMSLSCMELTNLGLSYEKESSYLMEKRKSLHNFGYIEDENENVESRNKYNCELKDRVTSLCSINGISRYDVNVDNVSLKTPKDIVSPKGRSERAFSASSIIGGLSDVEASTISDAIWKSSIRKNKGLSLSFIGKLKLL